jgi:hypothetical protein
LDPAYTQKLTDVLMAYDIGCNHPDVVDVPENRRMTIPLIPGWESRLPKSKICPLGSKDRVVVGDAFQHLQGQGRMSYATQHMAMGFPVFLVWRTVHKNAASPD